MKNKLYATIGFVALLALSGTASAHDMDANGPGQDGSHHHHHMCKDGKEKCHKGMRENFKKDKAAFEKMHALHEKLHAVLVAPKFDKKAFLALSGQMEQLHSQIERRHAEYFADMLAKMPQEKRARMAERFHRHMRHGDGGNNGWDNHIEWSHNVRSQNNQTPDYDRGNQ